MNTTLARRGPGNQPQQPARPGVLATLEAASGRIEQSLPPALKAQLTPGRLIQVASILVYKTPKLQECDPESIITSVLQAASLGLDLTPGMVEAYLIPRWNKGIGAMECQFQPGYKGLEKLAVRTGAVLYVQPREVYARDGFEVWHEDGRTHFKHRQCLDADRGRVTHYYAVARMADGSPLIEVMTADEVEAVHRRSEGHRTAVKKNERESGPWATDYDAMARKTVIRKLCKSLPRTSADPASAAAFEALNAAIEADNRQYEAFPAAVEPPKNDSGFGRGQYASPEQTAEYLAAVDAFLIETNSNWAELWAGKAEIEELGTLREVMNRHQADGHLLKWAVETGRLDPAIVPEEAKTRQLGRYAAIVYHRSGDDKDALGAELGRYAQEQWDRKVEAVYRKVPRLRPVEPEDESQEVADPDGDLPEGY